MIGKRFSADDAMHREEGMVYRTMQNIVLRVWCTHSSQGGEERSLRISSSRVS